MVGYHKRKWAPDLIINWELLLTFAIYSASIKFLAMKNVWDDIKKNITDWSIVASEKAEEFTHASKLRIDILQLERKLSSKYVKLGLYVFSKTKDKNILNFIGDKKYLSLIENIQSIKDKIHSIKDEINSNKENVEVEKNVE